MNKASWRHWVDLSLASFPVSCFMHTSCWSKPVSTYHLSLLEIWLMLIAIKKWQWERGSWSERSCYVSDEFVYILFYPKGNNAFLSCLVGYLNVLIWLIPVIIPWSSFLYALRVAALSPPLPPNRWPRKPSSCTFCVCLSLAKGIVLMSPCR